MGAWGDGVMDSDAALDWMAGVADVVAEKVRRLLVRYEEHGVTYYGMELRAAAVMCEQFCFYGRAMDGLRPEVIRYLEKLLADKEWIGHWREADVIRESIEAQIQRLRSAPGAPEVDQEEAARFEAMAEELFNLVHLHQGTRQDAVMHLKERLLEGLKHAT